MVLVSSGLSATQYISIALYLAHNKNELYKTLDYWSRDILNFQFLEEGLGINSMKYILCMIFQEKFVSCCILLNVQISLFD